MSRLNEKHGMHYLIHGLTKRIQLLNALLYEPQGGTRIWDDAVLAAMNDLVDWWCDEGEYAPSDDEPTESQLQRMAEPREPPRGHDWGSDDPRWTP